jgi:hypothetical protein
MAQSPSPTNIVWDDAPKEPAPPPAPAPSVPQAAPVSGAPAAPSIDAPNRGHIIWDPPTKDAWDTNAPIEADIYGEQSKYHTLKAVARGFFGAAGAMTGESPAAIEGRNKKLGLEDPYATRDDWFAQIAGGFAAPMPSLPGGGALSTARAADAAGGTLGLQTGSRVIQMLESTLARLPGGGSIIRALKGQTDRAAHTSEDIGHKLSGGADASATGAGSTLKGQLGKAAERMKAESATHYDEIEKLIPPGTHVGVSATLSMLREITSPVAGAEATTATLVNPKLAAIRQGFEADIKAAGSESLPYSVLKKLRTKIGEQIEWGPFSTDTANGQLKRLYSSLTADMSNGAASVSPKAAAAVRAANTAYAASKEEQKVLNAVLQKAGGPEKVFASLISGTREGATTIKQVLTAIDQPSRNLLAASALQRMGRATPGAQDAAGGVFSVETFLTNWNRMSGEARQALFGQLPGNYAASVTQLAQNVERLKAYQKVLPNASNTAQAALWGGELASGITAVLTGNVFLAAKIAALPAGTKLLSTAMTNPQTVKWLVTETSKLLPPVAQAGTAAQVKSSENSDTDLSLVSQP